MESTQLGMGQELVDHALALLPHTQPGDLRYITECLVEALRDALRIAESRGRRLNHLN